MIAERLKTLRHELRVSKRELVKNLPINYSTYANYESGFREPNSETLQVLARYFGVSLDYLLGVSNNRKKAEEVAVLTDDEADHIAKYRRLDTHGCELVNLVIEKELERLSYIKPIYDTVEKDWVLLNVYHQKASAGLGNYLGDDSDTDYEEMRFTATNVSKRADFCIRIKGESMEPKICDGDIVFVKAVPKVDIDSVGIFMYEGEAFCKRLRLNQKKGTLYLESLNRAFASKIITNPEGLRTIGLVIGIAEK